MADDVQRDDKQPGTGDVGRRKPGRPRLSDVERRERRERLRDSNGNRAGIGDTERERTGDADRDSAGGSAEASGPTEFPQSETVGVEPPKVEPKRQRRGGRKSTKITGKQVEALTVQAFSIVAIMKNDAVWFVTDPATEIAPWSEQAAELLNEIPKEYIDAFSRGSAGVAVAFGLGSMVFGRIMEDRRLAEQARMEAARRRAPQMREQEMRAEPTTSEEAAAGTAPGHATVPGTGAHSTHPGSIAGMQASGSAAV